jgi:hypothetical protein
VEATCRWAQLIGGLDGNGRDGGGRTVLVAQADDRLVGYVMVRPGRRPGMEGFIELMSL